MRRVETGKEIFQPDDVEEPIDTWFHRPIAAILVDLLYHTPISPNQLTAISGICGIAAGICLALADRNSVWLVGIAGGFIFLSVIFDCCDGQLANLKGEASLAGRALDGGVDAVVITSVMFGFFVFLVNLGYEPVSTFGFGFAAGYSWRRQAEGFDFAKQRFIANTSSAPLRNSLPTLEEIKAERQRVLGDGQYTMAFFVSVFEAYTKTQRKRGRGKVIGLERSRMDDQELRRSYRTEFLPQMRLWAWNGVGTHQFLMYMTAFLSLLWPPLILVTWSIMIFPLNILAVISHVWGIRIENRLWSQLKGDAKLA